jgi:hypothetical protein
MVCFGVQARQSRPLPLSPRHDWGGGGARRIARHVFVGATCDGEIERCEGEWGSVGWGIGRCLDALWLALPISLLSRGWASACLCEY